MPRVRKGAARSRKHKRVLKAAKGYYGAASRRYRLAKQSIFRAGVHATRDRKRRKREFRRLWITRIAAACQQRGIRYSQLIYALGEAGIELNRKMLSEVAVADPRGFDAIVVAAVPDAVLPERAEPAAPEPKPPKAAKPKPPEEAEAKPKPKAKAAKKEPAEPSKAKAPAKAKPAKAKAKTGKGKTKTGKGKTSGSKPAKDKS